VSCTSFSSLPPLHARTPKSANVKQTATEDCTTYCTKSKMATAARALRFKAMAFCLRRRHRGRCGRRTRSTTAQAVAARLTRATDADYRLLAAEVVQGDTVHDTADDSLARAEAMFRQAASRGGPRLAALAQMRNQQHQGNDDSPRRRTGWSSACSHLYCISVPFVK
jgi:hypothetical protein